MDKPISNFKIEYIFPVIYIGLIVFSLYFLNEKNYYLTLNLVLAMSLPTLFIIWNSNLWTFKNIGIKLVFTLIVLVGIRSALTDLKGPLVYEGDCKIRYINGKGASDEIVFVDKGRTETVIIDRYDYENLAKVDEPMDANQYAKCNSKIRLVYFSGFERKLSLSKKISE
jgi:hypothetical protein